MEYEWKPKLCETYQKVGHQCKTKTKKKWQPKPPQNQNTQDETKENKEESHEEQDYPGSENVKSNGKNKGKGIMNTNTHENIVCQNGFDAIRNGDPGGSHEGAP